MPTITTVAVPPGDLRPSFTDHDWSNGVTRAAYSIDGYSPVIVTISIGDQIARMRVTTSHDPGRGAIWRHPDAAQRRALFDEALAKVGKARDGRIEPDHSFGTTGWVWRVDIKDA